MKSKNSEEPRAVAQWPVSYFDSEEETSDSIDYPSQLGQMLAARTVVERDGWVYPANLLLEEHLAGDTNAPVATRVKLESTRNTQRMSPPQARSTTTPPLTHGAAPQTDKTAASGLAIVGLANSRLLSMAPQVWHPAYTHDVVIDRYENESGLDGLNAQDIDGMFEIGEEIGGFRY